MSPHAAIAPTTWSPWKSSRRSPTSDSAYSPQPQPDSGAWCAGCSAQVAVLTPGTQGRSGNDHGRSRASSPRCQARNPATAPMKSGASVTPARARAPVPPPAREPAAARPAPATGRAPAPGRRAARRGCVATGRGGRGRGSARRVRLRPLPDVPHAAPAALLQRVLHLVGRVADLLLDRGRRLVDLALVLEAVIAGERSAGLLQTAAGILDLL